MILSTLFYWSSIIPCVDIVIIPIAQMRKLRLNSHRCKCGETSFWTRSYLTLQGIVWCIHFTTILKETQQVLEKKISQQIHFWATMFRGSQEVSVRMPSSAGSVPALSGMHTGQSVHQHTKQWLICGLHSTRCSSGHRGYSRSPLKKQDKDSAKCKRSLWHWIDLGLDSVFTTY